MINWFRNALSSEDDQDPAFVALVKTILIIATVSSASLVISQAFAVKEPNDWATVFAIAIITLMSGISLFLSYRKILWPGKLLVPIITLIVITFIAINAKGLHDSATVGFPIVIIVSSLLLGQKAIPVVTTFTILGVWTVAYFDFAGINPTEVAKSTGLDDVIAICALQIVAAGSINGLMRRLNRAVEISRTNEQAQIETNRELRELQSSLEEHIDERTSELSRRAIQFQAIAEISQVVIEARGNQSVLLHQIATVIGEQFDFYHVGIYLLDDRGTYASLLATNSEGGQKLLSQKYKVPVNRESLVGIVASTGKPLTATDTGDNSRSLNYPEFPKTRSVIDLPLRSGEQTIGILDVHSLEQKAFGNAEIEVLSVLADQVTIAIEVARQFEETQRSLRETERIYQQYVRQEYNQLVKSRADRGFVYKNTEVKPLDQPLQNSEILEAIKNGNIYTTEDEHGIRLAAPVKLRGQVIGTLNVNSSGNKILNAENIEIINAVADRMALALENVRLLGEAQRRAAKERTISEGAARVSAALDIESILQTTAEELERTLGGSEVIIQLETSEH